MDRSFRCTVRSEQQPRPRFLAEAAPGVGDAEPCATEQAILATVCGRELRRAEAGPRLRSFCIILYYTILYYTILYYTILYYTILYYTILYYTILYYTILYYTILYYTILYYTILYYTILYYTILYYTILYYKLLVPAPRGDLAVRGRRMRLCSPPSFLSQSSAWTKIDIALRVQVPNQKVSTPNHNYDS